MKRLLHSGKALLWLGVVAVLAPASGACSVLTDEQVIDTSGTICPIAVSSR